jgi:uncharacterized protein (DUF488 family)
MEGSQIRTIGYGSRSIEEFVDAVLAVEVAYVVDVRSAPYSKFKTGVLPRASGRALG